MIENIVITGAWPPPVDSLPVGVDDPPNYHHRRLTAEGHPLMGSSPAEREESRRRGERARAESTSLVASRG